MVINTLYLKGFNSRLFGRQAESEVRRLRAKAQKLDGLAAVVARFIPAELFANPSGCRKRVYTPWVTFCAFLGQVLQRGSSCQEAVRRVQAMYGALGDKMRVDDATGGYCQARERLNINTLKTAFTRIAQWCATRTRKEDLWQGRIVKVMDGCGISMPDTPANRADYPYAGGQKPGCGFPTGQLLGLFSLCTGHLVRFVVTSWKLHEAPLAQQLVGWVNKGEVLLADRAFSCWGLLALFQRKGVDVVMRLHQARKTKLGRVNWTKPKRKKHWTIELWDALPESIELRVVRFRVEQPGFRTQEITLVTTLLDEVAYPDAALADLFRRRWQVELFFRDIKTTLGLDVLRTQSPAMIEKEILLQAIAYNLVRALMLEAAKQHDVPPCRLSFKGTVGVLRAFAPLYSPDAKNAAQRYDALLLALAAAPVPLRPNRSEPRAVKRRPKSYQLLTKPRREMTVSTSRRQKTPITPP
jgi:Transposase DDE domain